MRRSPSNQDSPMDSQNGIANGEKEEKSRTPLLSKRPRTQDTISQKYRSSLEKPASSSPNLPSPDVSGTTKSQADGGGWRNDENTAGAISAKEKEKKKGVSFLSRLIPGTGGYKTKRAATSDFESEHNEPENYNDLRPEGMDAQLFSYSAGPDNIGFNPRYPHPPPYIKVRSKFKAKKEFDRIFLAQELRTAGKKGSKRADTGGEDPNAVWCLEFSKDGRYLSAGGKDGVVRVWIVIASGDERREHEKEEDEAKGEGKRLSAPVFRRNAIREYGNHGGAVIDLNWSKNNFLLSSSLDKSIRLFHPSRPECLLHIAHPEPVLSLCFHPRDDRFFLAGSRDTKLRLWSIPDKSVAFVALVNDVITAVSFTPDGKTAMAGTIKGECYFFDVGVETGLRRREDNEGGKLEVRSKMGKNARGSRVNGIVSIQDGSSPQNNNLKLLISSADSRIRLYNFKDKSLEAKFKGHEAEELPIRALASDDGRYVVSGSEDRGCYIWTLSLHEQNKDKPAHHPLEYFDATAAKTTVAILAPQKTRELLAKSEDPIYDLCNPPPVTLMSRSESLNSSHGPTETGSVTSTPNLKGKGGSPKQTPTATPKATPNPNDHSRSNTGRKAQESPAYQARCAHPDGNIIVAASSDGSIRVYRQDCAFSKRRHLQSSDTWESSSTFAHHGKRPSSFYMAQAMSPHSRGSGGGGGGGSGSFQGTRKKRSDSQASSGTQPPGERILSWRQGVNSSTPSLNMERGAGRHGSNLSEAGGTPMSRFMNRSSSPGKSMRSLSLKSGSRHGETTPPRLPEQGSEGLMGLGLTESPTRVKKSDTEGVIMNDDERQGGQMRTKDTKSRSRASDSITFTNPLWLQGGKSYMFWDPKQYAPQYSNSDSHLLSLPSRERPHPMERRSKTSVVSVLTSEGTSGDLSIEEERDSVCPKCGEQSFRERFVGSEKQAVCEKCGRPVDPR